MVNEAFEAGREFERTRGTIGSLATRPQRWQQEPIELQRSSYLLLRSSADKIEMLREKYGSANNAQVQAILDLADLVKKDLQECLGAEETANLDREYREKYSSR